MHFNIAIKCQLEIQKEEEKERQCGGHPGQTKVESCGQVGEAGFLRLLMLMLMLIKLMRPVFKIDILVALHSKIGSSAGGPLGEISPG